MDTASARPDPLRSRPYVPCADRVKLGNNTFTSVPPDSPQRLAARAFVFCAGVLATGVRGRKGEGPPGGGPSVFGFLKSRYVVVAVQATESRQAFVFI